jgi:sugar-specific transcriptional regulator TrmB
MKPERPPVRPSVQEAIRHLVALGLTQYEARVYAALVQAGESKVGTIHMESGVPRSAIYGTLKRLESRGLADHTASTPARFRPAPPAVALRRTRDRVDRAAAAALGELNHLRQSGQPPRSKSLWVAEGRGAMAQRLPARLAGAKKEIQVLAHPRLAQRIKDDLEAAAARGVHVIFINGGGRGRRLAGELVLGALDRRAVFYGSRYGGEEEFAWSENPPFVQFVLRIFSRLGPLSRLKPAATKRTKRTRQKRTER